jgi:hypothetical protein
VLKCARSIDLELPGRPSPAGLLFLVCGAGHEAHMLDKWYALAFAIAILAIIFALAVFATLGP